MKITLHSFVPTSTEVVVFPLQQGEHLKSAIETIAARFNIPTASLVTDFKANLKEILPLYVNGNVEKIFLLGLGEKPSFHDFLLASRSFTHQQKGKIPATIAFDLLHFDGQLEANKIEAIVNGVTLGRYSIALHKTSKTDTPVFVDENATLQIVVANENSTLIEKAINDGVAIGTTQLRIFDLMNAPANFKTPQMLARWSVASGEKLGYKVNAVLGREAITDLGCHALLAVNKGSEEPPAFIIMEYKPKKKGKYPTIGLVGKGVTFDTGGVSIKPSTNMHNMKSDMGGAAAVFGTMEVAAKLQLPVHLIGIVPSTENCVDGASTKPSEVFNSYLGKTIEMIDTDAEGRLILADGLAYINKNFTPDTIIDLATLTGSCIATLGYAAAGMFTNNDDLAADLYKVGQVCGEKVWRLPLWDAYKDDLTSDVADVRNFSGKPVAGAITAAKFLEVFVEQHPSWVHLDIAGVAFTDGEFAHMKSGTAYGVRLLTEYIKSVVS